MALSRSRIFYIAAMLVAGLIIGLIIADRPALRGSAISPVVWPFLVSLVLDIALRQVAAQGRGEPLTMGDRFIGVFGAGLIVTLF